MFNFVFFLFVLTSSVFADCSFEFAQIDKDCIRNTNKEFRKIRIPIKKENQELINQIYFYKTASSDIGKLKILSFESNVDVCSIYIEPLTYKGAETISPSNSLTIRRSFGSWSQEAQSLNRGIGDDLKLTQDKDGCTLEIQKGMKYGKDNFASKLLGSDLLYYSSLFLMALAVFLISITIFKDEDQYKAQATLEEVDDEVETTVANDIVLKYSKPFFKRYFSPVVKGMKNKKKIKTLYKQKIANAGLTQELSPEDFLAFKIFLIVGFPVLFFAIRWFLEADWSISLVPLVSIIGFYYPNIWIKGKIQKRQKDITSQMPFVVDMLALSVEAGLDFMAAIQRVLEKAPQGALVDEFEILIKETRIGASRADGLRQMAWRVDMLSISSFCATLIAADSVGASIGPILKTLAVELRQKKSADVEKLAATASTKILIPTIFLIIPSVLIMMATPMIIDYISGP